MATIQLAESPFLQCPAQVLVIPANTTGKILHPVINRAATLYPKCFKQYTEQCHDDLIDVGDALILRRHSEAFGLSVATSKNHPIYIAFLIVSNHPYQPIEKQHLSKSVASFCRDFLPLIRLKGIRQMSFFASALLPTEVFESQLIGSKTTEDFAYTNNAVAHQTHTDYLSWQDDILPILQDKLLKLPRVRVNIHYPKH